MSEKIMNKVLCGDSLNVLKTLPSQSVDCTVTSPPYWALRDYGIHQFGGDAGRGNKVKIPARPFLKWGNEELNKIYQFLQKELN